MSLAFVFPGQGSQSVGMLSQLADRHIEVRATFQAASRVLNYDLWRLVQEGPDEQLKATERTQPAMLAAGVAIWRVWCERGGSQPQVVSGHSLGEFSALVCAGALVFEDAVELVRFRGMAMQEAVPQGTGAMAAILGLEEADIEAACAEAAQGGVVSAANFNSPGQVVIAGDVAAVQRAIAAAKARGAKRAVPLPVSAPFHCALMLPAAERLRERLANVVVQSPRIAFRSAVDAQLHSDPDDIRELLVRQASQPVRWTATVRALIDNGTRTLVECGPGNVLSGLNRRISKLPDLQCLALDDDEALQAALSSIGHTA
jgi:[acyl-carrier-protein] S-malonyltransferase